MAVQFQDYYKILGVEKTSSQEEVQRAYRKLARKYHPDVNKSREAEEQFKSINEAYEVLKDPEKRKRYDTFGQYWQEGGFQPPPEWEHAFKSRRGPQRRSSGTSFHFGGAGGFSDFFNMLFGEDIFGTDVGRPFSARATQRRPAKAELTISLSEAYHGATKHISLETVDNSERGVREPSTRTYRVKIPKGVTNGSLIRLSGKRKANTGTPPLGELTLTVKIAPDPRFRLEGHDLSSIISVSPWEAVLGAKIPVETLEGQVTLTIPRGTQNGTKLRLRGRGLPTKDGKHGDLIVEISVAVPQTLTESEEKLFRELARTSDFDPRKSRPQHSG